MGTGSTCDFFFSDYANNVYHWGLCQCSLDGSSGYCPTFNQDKMYTYLDTMKDYWSRGTFCHTADRYNIVAQAECGLGLTAREDPLWQKAVE